MQIQIRDYRGVERADIELAPIALIAGQNEQGKSCLAQAVQAALAGLAIVVPGLAKKDGHVLVRDGAKEGHVVINHGELSSIVRWPKCEVLGSEYILASEYAAGIAHPFDLDDAQRAKALARFIDCMPTQADLKLAMQDTGYGQKAMEQVWQSIQKEGWDGTHKRVREYNTNLKGQWEGVTAEKKYGPKKAEDFRPTGWDQEAVDAASIDAENTETVLLRLTEQVQACHESLNEAIASLAVEDAEVERLRALVVTLPELEKKREQEGKQVQKLLNAHNKLAANPPKRVDEPMLCPSCTTPLVLDKDSKLKIMEKAPTPAEIQKAAKAIEEHDKKLAEAKTKLDAAQLALRNLDRDLGVAIQAKEQLDEIEKNPEEKKATQADVNKAREKLEVAQWAKAAYDTKTRADRLHAEIQKNEKLAEVLAPDGLRKRKLAAGLKDFNDRLASMCNQARSHDGTTWPAVRFDENLQPHYGNRPVWAASASGKWRARTIVQLALAEMEGAAAVVLDEADILDARGRNCLFTLLQAINMPALVCMTINKPELVPDLAKAGIGSSYWVASGKTSEVVTVREARVNG